MTVRQPWAPCDVVTIWLWGCWHSVVSPWLHRLTRRLELLNIASSCIRLLIPHCEAVTLCQLQCTSFLLLPYAMCRRLRPDLCLTLSPHTWHLPRRGLATHRIGTCRDRPCTGYRPLARPGSPMQPPGTSLPSSITTNFDMPGSTWLKQIHSV